MALPGESTNAPNREPDSDKTDEDEPRTTQAGQHAAAGVIYFAEGEYVAPSYPPTELSPAAPRFGSYI